jgi:sulfonate transport system ATP-binding protein
MDGTGAGLAATREHTVSLRGLYCRIGETDILHDIDLDIAKGEFVALLGKSGSGKTTLLRALAGLQPITVADSAKIPSSRAVVFQDARLLPWKRVWQNVILGLNVRDKRATASAALAEVDLGHRQDAWPLTLSGGEAQRAALARALVRNPGLLLLDEPFAALDALTRVRMHDLVRNLWLKHGPSVLLVTHDVDEAVKLADRILVLDEGRLVGEVIPSTPFDLRRTEIESLKHRLLSSMSGHGSGDTAETPFADRKPRNAS